MNEKQASVAARIAELSSLPMPSSGRCGIGTFPAARTTPTASHVESRIAYKLQEEAFGGLAPDTRSAGGHRCEALQDQAAGQAARHQFRAGHDAAARMGRPRAQGGGHRRGAVRVRGQHLQEPDGGGPAHHRHALVGAAVLRPEAREVRNERRHPNRLSQGAQALRRLLPGVLGRTP
jgi:hypothetical protein